jgi:hypothetical protein
MLNHFTSKAYLVYAKYWGIYSVGINAITRLNNLRRIMSIIINYYHFVSEDKSEDKEIDSIKQYIEEPDTVILCTVRN